MNLKLIERFIIVGKYKNYTKAGAAEGIPRESLLRNVASLEVELGVKLLERSREKKGMDLTPEGKKFLDKASRLIASVHKLINDTKLKKS